MRFQWLSYSLIVLVGCVSNASINPNSTIPEPQIQYKVYDLPNSKVHTLFIPAQSRYRFTIGLASTVDTLENFAQTHQAVAVFNAGFFDPNNSKTTSYVIQQGKITADPRKNERLMNNPNLTPYHAQILNRSEWRNYQCGNKVKYAITFHHDSIPEGCQLIDAVGGGPQLLPQITAIEEGFLDMASRRDALGINRPNARTAIAITGDGGLILVMVAQKPGNKTSGLSLPQLAEFLKTLDVEVALNLDGGSSSALYYQDRTIYGKVDEKGQPVKRSVKSVLLIK